MFISRSEADLIGLVEAGHTPPCQGLAWRLLAPGAPQALHSQAAASLALACGSRSPPTSPPPSLVGFLPREGKRSPKLKQQAQAADGNQAAGQLKRLNQIKTTSRVCTELPVTKCLRGCDLAGLTEQPHPTAGWGYGWASAHGCVTKDNSLPSLGLCFLPRERTIPGPHPAIL